MDEVPIKICLLMETFDIINNFISGPIYDYCYLLLSTYTPSIDIPNLFKKILLVKNMHFLIFY